MTETNSTIITRKAARESGSNNYFTGKPCKHGHISKRLVINGSCCECSRIKSNRIYHQDVTKSRATQKIRRDSDPHLTEKKLARKLRQDPDLFNRKAARQIDVDARSDAKSAGVSKYQSIKPCTAHGHVGYRFTSDTKCVECNRINCLSRYQKKPPEPGKEHVVRRTLSEIKTEAIRREAARLESVKWWSDIKASRRTAIDSGAVTYVGRKCPRGHDGTRYTSGGGCVTCAAVFASSKEKKTYDAEYGQKNRERLRLQHRAYSERTAPARLANSRKWIADNPEKRRSISKAYKARRRAQEGGGDSTAELHKWEMAAPKVCHWCGIKCPKKYHVDHYQPLSKGGKHAVANLVIACPKCNLKKSAKDPYEFAASVGRLF